MPANQNDFLVSHRLRFLAEQPREDEHHERDHDVRGPERERGVVADPLVEDVPRPEPEVGLELESDPEREEEEAGDQREEADDRPAADMGRLGQRRRAARAAALRRRTSGTARTAATQTYVTVPTRATMPSATRLIVLTTRASYGATPGTTAPGNTW